MAFSGALLREKALGTGLQPGRHHRCPALADPRSLPALDRPGNARQHGLAGASGPPGAPTRPERHSAGVQTLLVVGLDYAQTHGLDRLLNDPTRGRIAAYAWGLDYHDLMSARLEQLAAWLQDESGRRSSDRVYVDTGAILERSHAQQAGLGFFGKNTMLIHPRRGSHFFIGEILTSLEVDDHDRPQEGVGCGTCTRCLDVCPTDAFPRPFVLDARLCISYLTIEHKGWIDRDLRPLTGNWIFGCDLCQDVCPFQRFSVPARDAALQQADPERIAPALTGCWTWAPMNSRVAGAGRPCSARVTNCCCAMPVWRRPTAPSAPPFRP